MSSKSSIEPWALTRLKPLLPLPEDSLKEVISYALSLTDAGEVGSHFEVGKPPLPIPARLTLLGPARQCRRCAKLHLGLQFQIIPTKSYASTYNRTGILACLLLRECSACKETREKGQTPDKPVCEPTTAGGRTIW